MFFSLGFHKFAKLRNNIFRQALRTSRHDDYYVLLRNQYVDYVSVGESCGRMWLATGKYLDHKHATDYNADRGRPTSDFKTC